MSRLKSVEKNKGYNIIDLIITIAIMSILAVCIAPSAIKFIDKSRKAVDVTTAETIFNAANLAACSSDDEVYDGWFACDDVPAKNENGVFCVTADGHRNNASWLVEKDRPWMADQGYYDIRPVAWCRGKQFKGTHSQWENTLFKATYDSDTAYDNKKVSSRQMKYTNGFLSNLFHDAALSERDHGGVRKYDGEQQNFLKFRYRKDSGRGTPECWILYKRSDSNLPEVWIGYKSGAVRPIYRLYPNPCDEYR